MPLRYDATVWSIVFPLGVYAVAGICLGRADHLPRVGIVGSAEVWCAFTVWCVAFAVIVVHLRRSVVHVGPATVKTQENA
ncbi:C4-dicarboxylate ABC transporter [Rhodococcus opacus]|uniref:C4-dicarboxylate ABC transporter n=1 Tax=Rhodococcus opacus TaxID=37919 RepID=A0A2S8JAP7_RHOOP|nr:C4-dicarboxylate ABC transporter [Rhodococcus opacus]PQP24121.1 C4-dicarboxylate ABC transporter [Rhodococcus opacus]